MADKQIVIKDYFNILRDDYGRIYCIQEIGDPKSLIKAIREQNDYIQAKEQECEELKKSIEHWKMEHKETKAKGEWTYDLVKKRLGKQLDQLKVELEQEKALKETYLVCYKAKHEDIEGALFKLKQTLAEIKALAIALKNICPEFIKDGNDSMKAINEILQKISECGVKQ